MLAFLQFPVGDGQLFQITGLWACGSFNWENLAPLFTGLLQLILPMWAWIDLRMAFQGTLEKDETPSLLSPFFSNMILWSLLHWTHHTFKWYFYTFLYCLIKCVSQNTVCSKRTETVSVWFTVSYVFT